MGGSVLGQVLTCSSQLQLGPRSQSGLTRSNCIFSVQCVCSLPSFHVYFLAKRRIVALDPLNQLWSFTILYGSKYRKRKCHYWLCCIIPMSFRTVVYGRNGFWGMGIFLAAIWQVATGKELEAALSTFIVSASMMR